MDFKLLTMTFWMVFLAELGDKTQLATFCISADCSDTRWTVFIGSAAALVLSSALAVMLGGVLGRLMPEFWIKLMAGVFFVAVGIWMLYSVARTL